MAALGGRGLLIYALSCLPWAGVAAATGDGWAPEVALTPQQGHAGPVGAVAFCPEGRLLVTGGRDGTARLWEVSSGREVRAFAGHHLAVRSVACSPAGDFIATASEDGTVGVWDVATGKERRRLAAGEEPLTSLALSPDGGVLLAGSLSGWLHAWDAVSGAELRSWRAHQIQVSSLAFSPGGTLVGSASFDTSVRLWDVRTGEKLRQWNRHGWLVTSVQFSPDGKLLLSAGHDKTARLFSVETGVEVFRLDGGFAIQAARFSPDGARILAIGEVPRPGDDESSDGVARLWETVTGREVVRFSVEQEAFVSVAVSPDKRLAASASSNGRVRLWDLGSGKEVRSFAELSVRPLAAAASPDGRLLLAGDRLDRLQLWDLAEGRPRKCFGAPRAERMLLRAVSFLDSETAFLVGEWGVQLWSLRSCTRLRSVGLYSRTFVAAALSGDRRSLVTRNADGTATVWDVERDEPLRQLTGHEGAVLSVAISPDGRQILTGGEDGTARLWDRETGEALRRIELSRAVEVVAFSPDGKRALTATANAPTAEVLRVRLLLRFDRDFFDGITVSGGEIRLWDIEGWREVLRTTFHPVQAAAFSGDGRAVLVGAGDGTARLLEAPSGREVSSFPIGAQGITAVGFLGGTGRVLTATSDGFVRLWDGRSGRELVRLASFRDGDWAAVTPDGRFDTNDPGELEGLSWVVSDDPATPLPVDVFLREYYEPRLLARTLKNERFPPLPSIANLNRVRPEVQIVRVEPEGTEPSRVRVTVEVSGREKAFRRGAETVVQRSGAKEVRLFRDGRLVGTFPSPGVTWGLEPPGGTATVEFRNVHLPRDGGGGTDLSAYAFNRDGVKSETVHRLHSFAAVDDDVRPRAYILNIGINGFEDSSLDLRFAANDARALRDTLVQGISAAGRFAEIVPVLLTSENAAEVGQRRGEALPTKPRIAAVLRALAGLEVDPVLLGGIPGADRLRAARPEDLVLITFSSHGETDEDGRFYLVPYDSGRRSGGFFDPRRLISADELSAWLRGIDGGEIVLVIDACRSAASVASMDFKPGPMDSRSLGQLAYDKKMRVLAATQADDVALESDHLRHGFLTYSLVREGIAAGKADDGPEDGDITLGEWLRFAVKRVPELYSEVMSRIAADRGVIVLADPVATEEGRLGQRPELFDFSLETEDPVVLARTQNLFP